jgi:4-hydroxybutyrate dehydrogenase
MAQAMGLTSAADIGPAIKAMNARLGLPGGLAEMGVQPSQFDAIITGALADHCHKTGPRLATRTGLPRHACRFHVGIALATGPAKGL